MLPWCLGNIVPHADEFHHQEDGVGTAIQCVYRDMEYAKTLVKRRKLSYDGAADDSEETWTFIGDESDPELRRAIVEWEAPTQRKPYSGSSEIHGPHQQAHGVREEGPGGGTTSSENTESSG